MIFTVSLTFLSNIKVLIAYSNNHQYYLYVVIINWYNAHVLKPFKSDFTFYLLMNVN